MTVRQDSIADGPRKKRATLIDVARHAGVSVASASKVVRDAYGVSQAMRLRVQASIEELGYRPHRLAQGMRGHTNTVGVLVPDIENPFFSLLVDGALAVIAESRHELFLAPAGATAKVHYSIMESLIDHQMDGLILVSPRGVPERLERVGSQIPVVVVGRHGPARAYDTVSGDDGLGSRLIVDHLVELGHSKIAFLANVADDDPRLPEHVRLAGYRAAMASHGLDDATQVLQGVWTFAGGRAVGQELAKAADRPTAVHAGADIAALGILSEFWDCGVSVPEDVAVAGYDNSPTAALRPISLTSVDQSGVEMGTIAARLLLERMAGRSEPSHEVLEPTLVTRSTTGRRAST